MDKRKPPQKNIDLCTRVYLRSEYRGLFDHGRIIARSLTVKAASVWEYASHALIKPSNIGLFYGIKPKWIKPPKTPKNIDLCPGVYLRSECRGLFDHDRSLA